MAPVSGVLILAQRCLPYSLISPNLTWYKVSSEQLSVSKIHQRGNLTQRMIRINARAVGCVPACGRRLLYISQ